MAGTEIPGCGGRGRLYLTLHCHHQDDSCIQMGSDESHFNVLLTVRGKVTRQCLETTTFEERKRAGVRNTNVCLCDSKYLSFFPFFSFLFVYSFVIVLV